MRRRTLLIILLCAAPAASQNSVPRFTDYPVAQVYTGATAPLALTREDRAYRTRLREAARERPNFAGHYIVAIWGCGASCVMGAVIDARTGRVTWFPHTVCCWGYDIDEKFNPVEFRLRSSLIIFSGVRNEREGDEGVHFYKFENQRFKFIRTIKRGETNSGGGAEKVLEKDGWELTITYRAKGTRSEGQHGVLRHEGRVVEAKEVGETINTPLGEMKYYGDEKSLRVKWDPSGWNFADRGRIKPSGQDKAAP